MFFCLKKSRCFDITRTVSNWHRHFPQRKISHPAVCEQLNSGKHTPLSSFAGRILFGWWLLFIDHACICTNVSLHSLLLKKSSCRHGVSRTSEIWTLADLADDFVFFYDLGAGEESNELTLSCSVFNVGIGCFAANPLLITWWEVGNAIRVDGSWSP